MSRVFGKIPFPVVVIVCLFFGCGGGNAPAPTATDDFKVVAFSDLHFNPFYDPSLYPALAAAEPSEWASIFQGSKLTSASTWGTDSNYPLMQRALASVRQNIGESRVILFTGDLLGHYIPSTFYSLYCPRQDPPCSPSSPTPAAIAAMEAFTDKTLSFVTAEIRSAAGNIPVEFAVGNIDSYTGYGPDATFLANNAESFYTQMLNSSVDQQTFLNTFTSGGFYASQPLGAGLLVLGLNTNPFSPLVNNQSEVTTELTWLNTELASAQSAGQKVWLLMHIPPGADVGTTTTNAAKAGTPGKITPATTAMMWVQDYQTNFLELLAKYPGVVTLILGAHTHADEYRILSANNVLDQVPAISPCFGENPAFKIYTFAENGFVPEDYTSLNYDLAISPALFSTFYTFSTTYGMQGPLNSSLVQLYSQLVSDNATQGLYTYRYDSGNNSVIPHTQASWNPINSANWPIFACAISNIDEQDFINCVNSQ
jgi:sphingomyelin phosphodiesterase acid-like 3